MSAEPRRADERARVGRRTGVRARARLTLAESPELYLREEMV